MTHDKNISAKEPACLKQNWPYERQALAGDDFHVKNLSQEKDNVFQYELKTI